jgi:hypothetical protein
MTQPTPITVRHTPGCTVYVVAGHEFATPRAAIRAADAIDRHGRYVSPRRTTPDGWQFGLFRLAEPNVSPLRAQQSPPECPPSPAGTGALDASG